MKYTLLLLFLLPLYSIGQYRLDTTTVTMYRFTPGINSLVMDTLPKTTRDTDQVTIQIPTTFPCGEGCFLLGYQKAYRVTVHIPYQKIESDFQIAEHDEVFYYDLKWKRIKKYYPTPIKEGW